VTVYQPEDVQRVARDRRGLEAFVVPPAAPGNGNGHTQALTPVTPPTPASDLHALVQALVSRTSGTAPGQSWTPLYLSVKDAAAVSGLSVTCLKKLIHEKILPARKDRGWRIARRDLETL
jgi:hypothetical protein